MLVLDMDFTTKLDDGANDVGVVFKHTEGKRYKITKKTRTAIAVERYYIWDELYDKLVRKIRGNTLSA